MKRFIAIMAALFVAMAMVQFTATAANANTNEVNIQSSATASASSEVTSIVRALVHGATQVTWVNPNHSTKVSKKRLRKAPRIRTSCTKANRVTQSRQIFKKTRHARVVVVKKGSCLWNMGRYNNIEMGFDWTLKNQAVLVLKGRYYRHAFDLIGGKLRKNCWNYIGKRVNRYAKKVVQVRYNADIQEDVSIKATASATAKAVGTLQCTSGTLYGEASATSSATAEATIRVRVRTKLASVNAKRAALEAKASADASVKAMADASAKISLKCSDTPPPVTYQAPTVSVSAGACVKPGEATGVVTVSGANPNDVAAGGTFTLGNQSKSVGTVAAGGTANTTFTGLAAGAYSGTFSLGSPISKSATYTVTIKECDVPPVVAPNLIETETINDVVVNNTRTITVTGTVASGHSATLFASAKNGGSITANKTQTVSGNFTKTITYMAPSEVPVAGNGVAAGRDQVEFTLIQDDGQKDTIATNQFVITPRPVTPE